MIFPPDYFTKEQTASAVGLETVVSPIFLTIEEYKKLDEATVLLLIKKFETYQNMLEDEFKEYKAYKYARKKYLFEKENSLYTVMNLVRIAKQLHRDIYSAKQSG